MTGLDEIVKSIQKKHHLAFSNDLTTLLSAFAKSMQSVQDKFAGLNSLTTIAKSISEEHARRFAGIYRLEDVIRDIAKKNRQLIPPTFQDNIQRIVSQQAALTGNIAKIVGSFQAHPVFEQTKALSVVLQGISSQFVGTAIAARQWEDIKEYEEYTEIVAEFGEAVVDGNVSTDEVLTRFKNEVIDAVLPQIEKSKSSELRLVIFEVITILSFLFTFLSWYNAQQNISNQEVLEDVKEGIQKFKKEVLNTIDAKLGTYEKKRVAITDVNLRYKGKKRSLRLGIVKKGQIVLVLEAQAQHKWILISYIDDETGQSMVGYVFKKYFEKMD